MKNVLAVLRPKHHPNARALSAYLDRAVSADEAAVIEAHVGACAACARELAGLHAVRSLLSSLPQTDVPRSFHLRPADIAPQPRPQPSVATRLLPALSGAAAAAFVVLAALVLSGVGEHHSNATAPESAPNLFAAPRTDASAPAASDAQAFAPAVPAPGTESAAPTAAPAAPGAQAPGATPASNGLPAQPAAPAPASSEDRGFQPTAGTSAGTPASTSPADALKNAGSAEHPPSAPETGAAAPQNSGAHQIEHRVDQDRGAGTAPGWLRWGTIAALLVALSAGAATVRNWLRRGR